MQVRAIEMRMGVRLNLGDYQGINAEVQMSADLDPREDDGEACSVLRAKMQGELGKMLTSSHPNSMRAEMAGPDTKKELGKPAAKEPEKVTRTRRPKAEIEAEKAAYASPDDEMPEAGDEMPEDDAVDGDALLDELEDDTSKVTADVVKTALRQIAKEFGQPKMLLMFKEVGAKSFKDVAEEDYGKLFKACQSELSKK